MLGGKIVGHREPVAQQRHLLALGARRELGGRRKRRPAAAHFERRIAQHGGGDALRGAFVEGRIGRVGHPRAGLRGFIGRLLVAACRRPWSRPARRPLGRKRGRQTGGGKATIVNASELTRERSSTSRKNRPASPLRMSPGDNQARELYAKHLDDPPAPGIV